MKFKPLALAVATALGVGTFSTAVSSDRDRDHHDHDKRIQSVEFIGMQAPDTVKKKSDIYTTAKLKVTYKRGGTKTLRPQVPPAHGDHRHHQT